MTVYQETYDPGLYSKLHRWGEKKDFLFRLEAPSRALEAGMRAVGIGALLGLNDPRSDVICLFQHALYLKKIFWIWQTQALFLIMARATSNKGGSLT